MESELNNEVISRYKKKTKLVILIIIFISVFRLLIWAGEWGLYISATNRLEVLNISSLSDIYDINEQTMRRFFNSNWYDSEKKVRNNNLEMGLSYMPSTNLFTMPTKNGLIRENVIFFDRDAVVIFKFNKGKLNNGLIVIQETFDTPDLYIKDFEAIKEILNNEFGEPISDEEFWENEKHKNNIEIYGEALKKEDLSFFTTWETKSTVIQLILNCVGGEITYGINCMPT